MINDLLRWCEINIADTEISHHVEEQRVFLKYFFFQWDISYNYLKILTAAEDKHLESHVFVMFSWKSITTYHSSEEIWITYFSKIRHTFKRWQQINQQEQQQQKIVCKTIFVNSSVHNKTLRKMCQVFRRSHNYKRDVYWWDAKVLALLFCWL